ncbi:hypothetical protein BIV59_17700 [Bacillus sp. MUM 13]|nr:hypothetical protein BIV59_17700 [Bacillus sp. MUM 13]
MLFSPLPSRLFLFFLNDSIILPCKHKKQLTENDLSELYNADHLKNIAEICSHKNKKTIPWEDGSFAWFIMY